MAKKVKAVESKELGDPGMYESLGRQVEAIYNSLPRRVLHMLEDDGLDDKVVLTKEQLADLMREAFGLGAIASDGHEQIWVVSDSFYEARERAIQPLVRRYSGGNDDHGREVD